MDEDVFGPYSAKEVISLDLPNDVLVKEESIGEWHPANHYDFIDLYGRELGFFVSDDGTIQRSSPQPIVTPSAQPSIEVINELVPSSIKKWNWGAFFFGWIWGVCNGIYWPLISIGVNFIPYIGMFISLTINIALGINGNEWAWKAKRWDSVIQFKKTQSKWSRAILYVLLGAFIISILIAIVY